jgi:hypothetical protein
LQNTIGNIKDIHYGKIASILAKSLIFTDDCVFSYNFYSNRGIETICELNLLLT